MKKVAFLGFKNNEPLFKELIEKNEADLYKIPKFYRSCPGSVTVLNAAEEADFEKLIKNGWHVGSIHYFFSHSTAAGLAAGQCIFCPDTKENPLMHEIALELMDEHISSFIDGQQDHRAYLTRKGLTCSNSAPYEDIGAYPVNQRELIYVPDIIRETHISNIADIKDGVMGTPGFTKIKINISDAQGFSNEPEYVKIYPEFSPTHINEVLVSRGKCSKWSNVFLKQIMNMLKKAGNKIKYEGDYYFFDMEGVLRTFNTAKTIVPEAAVKGNFDGKDLKSAGSWYESRIECTSEFKHSHTKPISRQLTSTLWCSDAEAERILKGDIASLNAAAKTHEWQLKEITNSRQYGEYAEQVYSSKYDDICYGRIDPNGSYRTVIWDFIPTILEMAVDVNGKRIFPDELIMLFTPLKGETCYAPGLNKWVIGNRFPSVNNQWIVFENLYDNELLKEFYGEDFEGIVMSQHNARAALKMQMDTDGDKLRLQNVSDKMSKWLDVNHQRWEAFTPNDDEQISIQDLIEIQRMEHTIRIKDMRVLCESNGVKWTQALNDYILCKDLLKHEADPSC